MAISDSLPAADVALWLSRCPGPGAPGQASVSVSCTLAGPGSSENSSVLAALVQPTGSVAVSQPVQLPCAGAAALTAPVAVPVHVSLAAAFRSSSADASLSCALTGSDGAAMGVAALPVTVQPTHRPLFNDCMTVSARGSMRSTAFGAVNGTALLLAGACADADATLAEGAAAGAVSLANVSGCSLEVRAGGGEHRQ